MEWIKKAWAWVVQKAPSFKMVGAFLAGIFWQEGRIKRQKVENENTDLKGQLEAEKQKAEIREEFEGKTSTEIIKEVAEDD